MFVLTTCAPRPIERFFPPKAGCQWHRFWFLRGKKWPPACLKSEIAMAKINWSKARKFQSFEEKYQPGTVLRNGRVVAPAESRDQLSARAASAMREFEANMAKPSKKPVRGKLSINALKGYIAAAGLKPSEVAGGVSGLMQVAAEIYAMPVSDELIHRIRGLSKKRRRALCASYQKKHHLLSPTVKGAIRKRDERTRPTDDELHRLETIHEQLKLH